MEVIVNGAPHIDGRQAMSDLLESDVEEALGHYGERITRIEATLTDANGANKSGPADIHCMLETRLVGGDPVVVGGSRRYGASGRPGRSSQARQALASALELHSPQHTPRSVNSTAVLDG